MLSYKISKNGYVWPSQAIGNKGIYLIAIEKRSH